MFKVYIIAVDSATAYGMTDRDEHVGITCPAYLPHMLYPSLNLKQNLGYIEANRCYDSINSYTLRYLGGIKPLMTGSGDYEKLECIGRGSYGDVFRG